MKIKGNLSAMIMAGLLLLPAGTSGAEIICAEKRPLKPVRCVCGKLMDQSGAPVEDATVKVIKDGTDLAAVKTAGDGKFNFGELKAGRYELSAQVAWLKPFRSPIVVANPSKKCRRELVILLTLGSLDCGSYVMKQ